MKQNQTKQTQLDSNHLHCMMQIKQTNKQPHIRTLTLFITATATQQQHNSNTPATQPAKL
jgi:REP element-mobilizing transposase RayT